MDFNYTKIKLGNFLYRNFFPLYKLSYFRFKLKSDKAEIEILKKIIRPSSLVLDIGSNIGFYAMLFSKWTGDKGKVFCFEPDKENFIHLTKNNFPYKNVSLFNMAVSNKNETIKIYKSKLLNVDHRTYPVDNYESVEEIQAVCLDKFLAEKNITKVDVIKIDIQGFELTAFMGMERILENNKDIKIVTEFWPHGFKRAGTSSLEFFDFFDSKGFDFQLIGISDFIKLSRKYVEENNNQGFEFSYNVLIEWGK